MVKSTLGEGGLQQIKIRGYGIQQILNYRMKNVNKQKIIMWVWNKKIIESSVDDRKTFKK